MYCPHCGASHHEALALPRDTRQIDLEVTELLAQRLVDTIAATLSEATQHPTSEEFQRNLQFIRSRVDTFVDAPIIRDVVRDAVHQILADRGYDMS